MTNSSRGVISMKKWIGTLITLTALFMMVPGCSNQSGTESVTSSQSRSASVTSDAVSAVKSTMSATSPSGRTYQSASLQGGIAVLVDSLAAYWVKDNQVYAANGFAKTWSPVVPYSPAGIDFDSVSEAVGK